MEFLSDFGVQPILLLAQVVNFLVLLWILKKLLYKPILKILEERKQRIAQSLKNAQGIEKRLNELSEEEQKRIMKAASEGEKIIKQAQDSATQIIEEGKIKAEGVAKKVVDEARGELQLEREKLQQEIREHLAEFVILALQKVTGKIITQKDQKKMVEETVREIQ